MSQKSNFLENKLTEHVVRGIAYTSPATVYLALYTSATDEDSGGTEVSGNGYARQAVTFGPASGGVCANTVQVTFPTASPAGYGTVTHARLLDAATGGNPLYHGPLAAPVLIVAGGIFVFPIGVLLAGES